MAVTTHWNFLADTDLSGCTLVIPSVAVGNVGQLTCDLLISTLNMKKIASIYSPAFIPILGCDPYDLNSSSLSTTCELYYCEAKSLVVLQIRAPLVFKYGQSFLRDIVMKCKERSIKEVIILTSSFAHEKKHIMSSPFRFVANETCPHKNKLKLLNWVEHESTDNGLKIFGGGFASILYDICVEMSMPCLVLYKYCSEGDNIPDAYETIQYLVDIIPIFNEKSDLMTQLVQPVSWKLLFGRPPPTDIY